MTLYGLGEPGFDSGPDDMPDDEPSFAIGMCRGVRAFGLTPGGILTGATYRQPWVDGQNRAKCYRGYPPTYMPDSVDNIESLNPTLLYTSGPKPSDLPERPVDINEDKHRLKGCHCGFWSYWGIANSYMRPMRIAGIIEGYGRVVVGKKGFRCSLANIRAIFIPKNIVLADNVMEAMSKVPDNYPSAEIFDDFQLMLSWYPPDKVIQ